MTNASDIPPLGLRTETFQEVTATDPPGPSGCEVRAVCPTAGLEPETGTPPAAPPGPELLRKLPWLSAFESAASANLEFIADEIPNFGFRQSGLGGPRFCISTQALGISDFDGWSKQTFLRNCS